MIAPNPHTVPGAFLEYLYWAAVRRALPHQNLAQHLPKPPQGGRTLVLGAGKAAGAMAHAVDDAWPADAPLSGLVVTRYGHIPPRAAGASSRIDVIEAAHPVPDAASVVASQRMLGLTLGLTDKDLVLCLVSGGGSSVLTLPAQWPGGGVTLQDKQNINQTLLRSGASIAEMNCVRKHLSAIKGGRLAAACAPAQVVTLLISDVPGDDPSVIASGPTVPDATTCAQALAVLQRYAIELPQGLRVAMENGVLETPKPADPAFARCVVHMVATPQQSLQAAADAARAAGLTAYVLSDAIEGESREVGKVHAALARAVALHGEPFARPCVLLSGGETTVTVRPVAAGSVRGRGGRAAEFCMGLAQALHGQPGVFALAADTDGIDGTEDNAGAWVLPDTPARMQELGLSFDTFLDRNDGYGLFAAVDDLFMTGPTHTNVNDFRAILVL